MFTIDHRALISRADLIYRSPVAKGVEGPPIGNGRMGTLVWTTPRSVEFQINRVDVFAVGRNHGAHQAWPIGPRENDVDYCGGCARISVDLGGEVFTAARKFEQQLSLFDAEVTIRTDEVLLRCFISSARDVLVMEIDDRRREARPIRLTVSMWRGAEVRTGDHVARWETKDLGDVTLLVQRFEERDYCCSSAVAGTLVSRPDGPTMVFVASAASRSKAIDPGSAAVDLVKQASEHTYDALREEHAKWWSQFWSRTFVSISSPDGRGECMQNVRTRHLYYLATNSRGTLPAKWNGLLFITDGDVRSWGSQFWVWTTEMMYFPLFASDALDLAEPYFNMYVRQLPACEEAARQRWGVRGAFFPETTPFDGPVILPDDAAREFQDVYLGRKPVEDLSKSTHDLCLFDSSLRTVAEPEKQHAVGRFSWISHLVSSGSELAVQAWWRYRYTCDAEWLRTKAYPLLKGTVEFYRHLARRGSDGRYHIHATNVHEMFWGVNDGIMDLAAIRGTVPLAIRAAEILHVDETLRIAWKNFLDNLAPYPMGGDAGSKALTGGVLADDVWAAGHRGEVDGPKHLEDVWLTPVFPFEDWTLETQDPARDAIVRKTIDLAPRLKAIMNGEPSNTADRTPIAVARAGLSERLPAVLGRYYAAFNPLPNGMSLFEGAGAPSVEHLGCLATALQEALLQSISPRPGEPEVIRVFPAWPKEWDAAFRLLARGGFLVTASIRDGTVEFIEIESRFGQTCRLRKAWPGPCILTETDGAERELPGEILRFETRQGRSYRISPKPPLIPGPRRGSS